MKIYLVQWWSEQQIRYAQEYYQNVLAAANRVGQLLADVPNSDATIESIEVSEETYEPACPAQVF